MSETTEDQAVSAAFDALRDALNRVALEAKDVDDFHRIYAFRKRAIDLARRWSEGQPAHTPKGSKSGASKAEG